MDLFKLSLQHRCLQYDRAFRVSFGVLSLGSFGVFELRRVDCVELNPEV